MARRQHHNSISLFPFLAVLVCAMGSLILLLLVMTQALGHFALATLALMTVIIFAAGAIPVRHPSKLIEHLALMSFSMFLTNEAVRIVWFGAFDVVGQTGWPVGLRWSVWGGGLLVAVVAAAAFRNLFDRPSQKWLSTVTQKNEVGLPVAQRDESCIRQLV